MKTAFIGLFLLWALPVSAQTERTIFRVTLPIYGFVAIEDARQTRLCVEHGSCREVNPVLKPFVDRHGIRTTMAGKLAVQSGVAAGLVLLHHKYRWQSTAALLTLTGLQAWVDIRNYRTLHP